MAYKRTFRVVLASPSDVRAERDAAGEVVDSVNQMLRDADLPAFLELWRWETDVHPGLHAKGPQGLIDERLRIEDSAVLIGVFWQRFGTPVSDANSGTEHEVRCAIRAWKANGAPQVMLYFCSAPCHPASPDEAEQFQSVQAFKQELLSTDKALIWEYQDASEFHRYLHNHLWMVVMQHLRPRIRAARPFPFPRVSASANTVCARKEGGTELMGDFFLQCAWDSDVPPAGRVALTVTLYTNAPITNNTADGVTDAVLFEVGRPGATTNPVLGVMAPLAFNEITFRTRLDGISPH